MHLGREQLEITFKTYEKTECHDSYTAFPPLRHAHGECCMGLYV